MYYCCSLEGVCTSTYFNGTIKTCETTSVSLPPACLVVQQGMMDHVHVITIILVHHGIVPMMSACLWSGVVVMGYNHFEMFWDNYVTCLQIKWRRVWLILTKSKHYDTGHCILILLEIDCHRCQWLQWGRANVIQVPTSFISWCQWQHRGPSPKHGKVLNATICVWVSPRTTLQ